MEDPANLGYNLPTHLHPPIKVYTYPFVSHSPPFPFSAGAPIQITIREPRIVDAYSRSANNLSLTRTLGTLKQYLGPHFNFEKLWDMHTYYEFAERNALSRLRYFLALKLSKRRFRDHDHNGQTSYYIPVVFSLTLTFPLGRDTICKPRSYDDWRRWT